MKNLDVWRHRSEDDIQECIEEAFIIRGYRVNRYHITDRRSEKGLDLRCENPDEKIDIQVKIKPRKKDINQMKKLLESKSDKKIYIYVENPVREFEDEQKKISDKIKFWNSEELNQFLLSNQSKKYFRFLILSTDLARRFVSILKEISLAQETEPKPLERDQLKYWWVLKDRAVKLQGSIQLIRDWYQKELLCKDKSDDNEIRSYLEKIFILFEIIDVNSARDLLEIVKLIRKRYPQLLSQYVKVVEARSNWIGMPFGNKHIDNFHYLTEYWILPEKNDPIPPSFYNMTNLYLKRLTEISKAIEDGVDWIFEDSFGSIPQIQKQFNFI